MPGQWWAVYLSQGGISFAAVAHAGVGIFLAKFSIIYLDCPTVLLSQSACEEKEMLSLQSLQESGQKLTFCSSGFYIGLQPEDEDLLAMHPLPSPISCLASLNADLKLAHTLLIQKYYCVPGTIRKQCIIVFYILFIYVFSP